MNKIHSFLWLVIFSLSFPVYSSAYNLTIELDQDDEINYSYPAVLGDDSSNSKSDSKPESKEVPRIKRPEMIEIKRDKKQINVILKNQTENQQLKPQKVDLKFPPSTKTSSGPVLETDNKNSNINSTLEERQARVSEVVEIKTETNKRGQSELQLESRNIRARLSGSEVELDVNNRKIGTSDSQGRKVELIHLPDQAIQRIKDAGITSVPGSLEVGNSGSGFEYKAQSIKTKNAFWIIPRKVKYDVKVDDATGLVTETKARGNILERTLDLFTF